MTDPPRLTAFWKKQGEAVKAAIAAVFDDHEFLRVFGLCVAFTVQAERLRRASERRVLALKAGGFLGDAAILESLAPARAVRVQQVAQEHFHPAIVVAARSASPWLPQIYGEHRLGVLLGALVTAGGAYVLDNDIDAASSLLEKMAPGALAHLPGNPIGIITHGADGSLVLDVPATASRRDELDLDSYRASLAPAGHPGRPKGAPKPKGSGRCTIAEAACRDALTMSLPGWVKAHAADLDITDPKQAHRARGRFSSARQRAHLLGLG